MARFGIGWITPEEITEMIRPNLRSIMPGRARSARRTRFTNMDSKQARHVSDETPCAFPGGGPPLFRTRISMPPSRCRTSAARASTWSAWAVSHAKASVPDPMPSAAACDPPRVRLATATRAPSSARPWAMPRPIPLLAPRTRARLPSRPNFISLTPARTLQNSTNGDLFHSWCREPILDAGRSRHSVEAVR